MEWHGPRPSMNPVHTLCSHRKSVPDCWLTEKGFSDHSRISYLGHFNLSLVAFSQLCVSDHLNVLEIVPERIPKLKIEGYGFIFQMGSNFKDSHSQYMCFQYGTYYKIEKQLLNDVNGCTVTMNYTPYSVNQTALFSR